LRKSVDPQISQIAQIPDVEWLLGCGDRVRYNVEYGTRVIDYSIVRRPSCHTRPARIAWSIPVDTLRDILPFLLPILLLQLALLAFALVDLVRRPQGQVNGPKWAWAFIIILINIIGPIAYFLIGRREA
jgi:hypothetical protein